MASSSEAMSPEAAAKRVAALRNDVVHRWNLAGRPTPERMAATAGCDVELFRDFLEGRHGINPHLQLLAMNDALAASDEHSQRFKAAVQLWLREVGGPPTERSLRPVRAKAKTKRVNTPLTAEDPLIVAKKADSVAQFNHQLRRLMIKNNTSFADIGRRSENLPRSTAHHMVSNDRLPVREDQIRAFVHACGAGDAEQDAWAEAWRDARKRLQASAPTAMSRPPGATRLAPQRRSRRRDRILCTVTVASSGHKVVFKVTVTKVALVALVLATFLALSSWGGNVLRAGEIATGMSSSGAIAVAGAGLSVAISAFTSWRSHRYAERYRRGESAST